MYAFLLVSSNSSSRPTPLLSANDKASLAPRQSKLGMWHMDRYHYIIAFKMQYTSKRQRRDLAGINNIRIGAGLL
jgi:hypothetical protein